MSRHSTRNAADALTGRLLDGRYRIGPRVARGGMASVYEAVDVRLDRVVAVKVMHSGLGDDDEFAARFVREARSAARLSHPHVVGVFDQGDDDGTVYLVMEYVPGHTLRDVIRKESPMAPAKALALLDPMLAALAAAHQAGLVHRDVKPENVLIADDGRVKVADFGLARAVSADTQHTATGGVLIGTVSYLAPELVVDNKADARADVYAAGVVLYELLTGRKPHEGESPIQVAYKHVHEDIPPPSEATPGLPAYVDALVARATTRDRANRPADASVLLHHVHRVRQALADGVPEDPELVADLAPRVGSDGTEQLPGLSQRPQADTDEDDGHEDTTVFAGGAALVPAGGRRPEPVRSDPRLGPRQRRKPPRRRWLALGLVLALLAGVGVWWFGFARYTTTPSVIGLDQAAAEQRIEAAGLELEIGEPAFSETVPAGMVISTDPGADERVVEGGTVTATLSKGLERYDVPAVAKMTEDEAQAAILDANLEFGRSIPRYHDTIPEGIAIGTDPKTGTPLKRGSSVNLLVSQGPKPIPVTDWTGKSAEAAERELEKQGLVVEVTEEFDDKVEKGLVIAQTPRTGTLFKGETVELTVSKGPELVTVPRVRAMGVRAATERLESLGFVVRTRESAGYLGLGFVYSVSPGEGEKVPKGSTITLSLV